METIENEMRQFILASQREAEILRDFDALSPGARKLLQKALRLELTICPMARAKPLMELMLAGFLSCNPGKDGEICAGGFRARIEGTERLATLARRFPHLVRPEDFPSLV